MLQSKRRSSPNRLRRHRGDAMRGKLFFVLVVGALMSAPLFAHHGSAAFENGKPVTLKGIVKGWTYQNPHCLLTLDVKGDDGTVVQWIVETQAPNIMYPAGYRKDSFKFGDGVTVVADPVKNSSGSFIPGATVTAKNTGTGAVQVTTTDTQGRYRIPVLPVGDYQVQTELTGFQTVLHTGIRLSAGADVVVDFKLPIGQISELLTVTAEVPLVNTTSASLGTVVDPTQIRE